MYSDSSAWVLLLDRCLCFMIIANVTKIINAIPPNMQPTIKFVTGGDSVIKSDVVGDHCIFVGEVEFGSVDDDV